MTQLINLPGLKFHIGTLNGTLRYSLARKGKPPKDYELSDTDLEDSDSDSQNTANLASQQQGIEVSAVGFLIRLLKNDGTLALEFEGSNGASAYWTFRGLEEVSGKALCASVGAQTDAMNGREMGMQTEAIPMKHARVQTDPMIKQEVEGQGRPEKIAVTTNRETQTAIIPNAQNDEDPIQPAESRKRKRSPSPSPLDENARSTHESAPWPRHLYIQGYRTIPQFKGDEGKLHIDLHNATVYYEGWFGKEHMRCKEKKQIDLRDQLTEVVYCPLNTRGFEGYWHVLNLGKKTSDEWPKLIFEMHCGAPDLKIWGKHDLHSSKKITFTDPAIIVDALVHCIDRASGREAVHNPEADFILARDKKAYENLGAIGRLSGAQALHYGWTSDELKARQRRLNLRYCKVGEITAHMQVLGRREDNATVEDESESEYELSE